jgi:hypothetical protein
MCPLLPALQDAPLPLRRPASLGDALSREVDHGVKPCQISFDHARIRVPANVLARTWRARQTVDPVPSCLQLRDQSRPDKPLRPAHENVHALPPNAKVSSIHIVRCTALRDRMISPKILSRPAEPSQGHRRVDRFTMLSGRTPPKTSARPDHIYSKQIRALVITSMWMVYGCYIDVLQVRRRHE